MSGEFAEEAIKKKIAAAKADGMREMADVALEAIRDVGTGHTGDHDADLIRAATDCCATRVLIAIKKLGVPES